MEDNQFKREMDECLYLGIELGSTRVKAVICDEKLKPIASGASQWENMLVDGYWTYDLDDVWVVIQKAYKELGDEYQRITGHHIRRISGLGISGMMHGYLPFDKSGNLLTPFRTWRNNRQEQAAKILSDKFEYPIPQRFSIAHYYQAILNGEDHVADIDYLTTLAGYVHWQLTGQKAMGIGEASGMFPIDIEKKSFNKNMIQLFNGAVKEYGIHSDLEDLLPRVLTAGEFAGQLSEHGAMRIDPYGYLESGVPLCPPEGDAGTGMIATNSVKPLTGNISAGTSVFAMIVLDRPLKKRYEEIDLVMTPDGESVAMVHVNNGTSDLNGWVNLFREALNLFGAEFTLNQLYETLYRTSFEGEPDCGGVLAYGFVSGEHMAGLEEGRPLFIRKPDAPFTLANFMKAHLYSSLCVLRMGMDLLGNKEGVHIKEITGHGGFFKTKDVGLRYMSAALGLPVSTLEMSGEGGPYGMALLAAYMLRQDQEVSLGDFLQKYVFEKAGKVTCIPLYEDVVGFNGYLENYKKSIDVERRAVECYR